MWVGGLVLQFVSQLRQTRPEGLQLLETRLAGVDADAVEGLASMPHQTAERSRRRRAYQAIDADPEQLLLPALNRHAQVGSILERGVLGGVVDAAAAGAEALRRAVDGDL